MDSLPQTGSQLSDPSSWAGHISLLFTTHGWKRESTSIPSQRHRHTHTHTHRQGSSCELCTQFHMHLGCCSKLWDNHRLIQKHADSWVYEICANMNTHTHSRAAAVSPKEGHPHLFTSLCAHTGYGYISGKHQVEVPITIMAEKNERCLNRLITTKTPPYKRDWSQRMQPKANFPWHASHFSLCMTLISLTSESLAQGKLCCYWCTFGFHRLWNKIWSIYGGFGNFFKERLPTSTSRVLLTNHNQIPGFNHKPQGSKSNHDSTCGWRSLDSI